MYLTRLFLSITSDRGFKNISPVECQFFFPFIMFTLAKKKMIMWIHMYRYLLKLVRLVKIIAII